MSNTRKHYIDNLRWMILLILIPYHTAMAWNFWKEPNYIYFYGSKYISSFIVFFSPFFMPILFVLAGISTRYALQKRTTKEYIFERMKKLLIPLFFGTIVIMPVMTYIADKYNNSYSGNFLKHYTIFFGKFTDLTGADGGFSFGQFWFLLYLFVISVICVWAIPWLNVIFKTSENDNSNGHFGTLHFLILILGVPLIFLGELLSIGGKSLAEFTYLFLIGYYLFSNDEVIKKISKLRFVFLIIGLISSALNIYLFLWSGKDFGFINTLTNACSKWFMIIALIGLATEYLDFTNSFTSRMKATAFLLYIYHFIWVVIFEYLLGKAFAENTIIIVFGTIILSYITTFITCEISMRIPILCTFTGTKKRATH